MGANRVSFSAEGPLLLRASDNIQGNILAPFNKPYQRFLFISFQNRRAEARYWLRQLAGVVASTRQVVQHAADRAAGKEPTHEWVGVSFTSSGLVVLDSDLAMDLVAFDAFWQGPLIDREFQGARRTSPAVVGDVDRGDPTKWVAGGPHQYPIDALLTVAADDHDKLETVADDERKRAVECGLTVLSWQHCERLEKDGIEIEPFGFRDGISQPGIRGFTKAEVNDKRFDAAHRLGSPIIATGEFVLGYAGEGDSYPEVRRSTLPDWMRDGSFQVFLRLRQDVDGWRQETEDFSAQFAEFVPSGAAAAAIGRKVDGTPLAALAENGEFNNFTFEHDQLGKQTPRFSHIRKMNPRNGTFDDRTHRLLRRGISFMTPLHVETPLPGQDAIAPDPVENGLAFNAFMASIENQFEFLLRNWASNPKSLPPVKEDGPDPLVGTSDAPGVLRRDDEQEQIPFRKFVWTSGAVYGFAPSLAALRLLSGLKGGA